MATRVRSNEVPEDIQRLLDAEPDDPESDPFYIAAQRRHEERMAERRAAERRWS